MRVFLGAGAAVLVIGLLMIPLFGPGFLVAGLGGVMLAIGAIGTAVTRRS